MSFKLTSNYFREIITYQTCTRFHFEKLRGSQEAISSTHDANPGENELGLHICLGEGFTWFSAMSASNGVLRPSIIFKMKACASLARYDFTRVIIC